MPMPKSRARVCCPLINQVGKAKKKDNRVIRIKREPPSKMISRAMEAKDLVLAIWCFLLNRKVRATWPVSMGRLTFKTHPMEKTENMSQNLIFLTGSKMNFQRRLFQTGINSWQTKATTKNRGRMPEMS